MTSKHLYNKLKSCASIMICELTDHVKFSKEEKELIQTLQAEIFNYLGEWGDIRAGLEKENRS